MREREYFIDAHSIRIQNAAQAQRDTIVRGIDEATEQKTTRTTATTKQNRQTHKTAANHLISFIFAEREIKTS